MADTGGFDLVFQFRPVVVNDILTRQLNDPLAITAQAQKFIQRHLTLEAVLPSTLSWANPTVDCTVDDRLLASVAISGGIRPAVLNHNVTLSASAQMPLKTQVTHDHSSTPYIAAQITSAEALTLADVRVELAGRSAPVPLVGAALTQAIEPLRPFLAQNLLQSLARLSHTYMLGSIPARFPRRGHAGDSSILSITQAGVHVLTGKGQEALALGLSVTTGTPGSTGSITSTFADTAQTGSAQKANAALVVSAAGFTRLLEHACAYGRLQGRFGDSRARTGDTWRWTALTCIPSGLSQLQVSGRLLAARSQETVVTATVACQLDAQGLLVVTPSNPLDEIVVGALREALLRVLGTGDGEDGDGHLRQIFTIPQSRVSVETSAVGLDIEPGGLTLLYDVPLSKGKISFQFPARRPAVHIVQQPSLPTSSGPGAPLAVTLRAQVVSESFPPYDFEWTTASAPTPTAGAERKIVGTPTEVTQGRHSLTTAHLQMIDLIGQVATDERPVQYMVRQRSHLGRMATTATVLALIAALVLGGIAVARWRMHLPPFAFTNSTPVPTATAHTKAPPPPPAPAAPSIVVRPDGEIDIAVQGPANSLSYYYLVGGSWSKTEVAGDEAAFSAPSIVVDANGEAYIAVQGPSNSLVVYEATPGSGWDKTEVDGNGAAFSASSVFVSTYGNIDVAVQGPANSLSYYYLEDGGWRSTQVAGDGTT